MKKSTPKKPSFFICGKSNFQNWKSLIGLWLIIALMYILLGSFCLKVAAIDNYIAAFWFPSGLVTSLALKMGWGFFPGVFLGETIIGFLYGKGPVWKHLAVALSQCLEGATICYLCPRLMDGKDIFSSLKNLFTFLGAAVVGEFLHTLCGAILIPLLAGITLDASIYNWFIGGWLGTLLIAPLILSWWGKGLTQKFKAIITLDFLLLLLSGLMVILLINGNYIEVLTIRPVPILLPFFIWATFFFTPSSATLMYFLLILALAWIPHQPFSSLSLNSNPDPDYLALLQILPLTLNFTSLVMLVINGDRQRLTEKLKTEANLLEYYLEKQALELKKAQTELEKLGETALFLTENIPVGTYVLKIEPDGRPHFLFVSTRWLQFCHCTREEFFANQNIALDILHPDDREDMIEKNKYCLTTLQPFRWQGRILRDNEVNWVSIESNPRKLPDGSWIWEGVMIDITDRLKAEQELAQMNAKLEARVAQRTVELQTLNQKLLKANRLKDEFLATMSHELRTPLNAILGLTETLIEEVFGPLNERQRKSLNTIDKSGQHLLNLINDILDLSKIEAGQMQLNLTSTSVYILCEESLMFVKQQAFKKQINLQCQLPENLPKFNLDEKKMRQALINLLNNAVKFTQNGGQVTLQVIFEVKNEINPEMAILRFRVQDTGIGIAPENIGKLFQPFMQIDSALNRQYEGTGLGLALVKRIVELHGGIVGVNSELGVGSCFTMQVPVNRRGAVSPPLPQNAVSPPLPQNAVSPPLPQNAVSPPLPQNAVSPPQNAVSPPPEGDRAVSPRPYEQPPENAISKDKPPLILLAEDNPANVMTIESYLEAKGYRLIIAENGEEALKLVKSQHPDLILMDIQMPKMDGITAIKLLKQDPNFCTIPIIALTALAMEGDQERCLVAGAEQYLSKPVKLKELIQQIQELLS